MPNLDYDPQNPSDLLDRPIAVGDIVAWGTTWGRSPALCVARIEEIRFFRESNYKNVPCDRVVAEGYQLRLKPLKSTGSITSSDFVYDEVTDEGRWVDRPDGAKVKTIHLVKNVVKLEPMA